MERNRSSLILLSHFPTEKEYRMIYLHNVTKVYKKDTSAQVVALDDVSLSIDGGEFVAIVGPSGSGKSTLMNIIGLLDSPASGEYILDGQSVDQIGTNSRARLRNEKLGFVFQSFHLLPKTSALENVELPLVYSRKSVPRKSALKTLKKVSLGDRLTHVPNELSGGQQQRVAIARALVTEPEIILADEPTGNLDSTSSNEIISIFQTLNQEGKTIILITHDEEIARCCSRIVRMNDGQIIEDSLVDKRTNIASIAG